MVGLNGLKDENGKISKVCATPHFGKIRELQFKKDCLPHVCKCIFKMNVISLKKEWNVLSRLSRSKYGNKIQSVDERKIAEVFRLLHSYKLNVCI